MDEVRHVPGPWQMSVDQFFHSSPDDQLYILEFMRWFSKLTVGPVRVITREFSSQRVQLNRDHAISALGRARESTTSAYVESDSIIESTLFRVPEINSASALVEHDNIADWLVHRENLMPVMRELVQTIPPLPPVDVVTLETLNFLIQIQ